MKSTKIGVFGGSFNPIHLGHINILENFIEMFNLDFIILIPNKSSPFKTKQTEISKSINYFNLESKDILELIRLNTAKYNNIIILDYELNSDQINYSIDTFEYINSNILELLKIDNKIYESNLNKSNIEYYYLIGDDNFIDFQLWKNWEELINNVNLVIGLRNNSKEEIEFLIDTEFKNYKQKIFLLNNLLFQISSTEVRELIFELSFNYNELDKNKSKLIDKLGLITYNYLQNKKFI